MITQDVELIKRVIMSQDLTHMSAWDLQRVDKIDFHDARSAQELAGMIDELVANVTGPFRLECWGDDAKLEKGGAMDRGGKRAPFVWRLIGLKGTSQPAPIAGHEQAKPQDEKVFAMLEKLADVQLKLEIERLKREQLEQELEAEDDEDEDETVEASPQMAAPVQWTPQDLIALTDRILDRVAPIKSAPVQAIRGIPAPAPGEDDTENEALLRAMARLKMADPDSYATYTAQLLKHYGDQHEQPAANESAGS